MSLAAESTDLVVAPGGTQTFAIGGIGVRVRCRPDGDPLTLPRGYRPFVTIRDAVDVCVRVGSTAELEPMEAPVIYGGGHHWRARVRDGNLYFEIFYPPTQETYCRMVGEDDLADVDVVFGRDNLKRLPPAFHQQNPSRLWFPHPFEQIVVIPALARRDGFLVHACGAVWDGKAYVFAGHSGDGKTTLARLLAAEGVELLSDERVVVRETDTGFEVHGTPWAGEGEVVSSARFPLGGVFVLRKAPSHRLVNGATAILVAEVLARSLVPYYLPRDVARIVSLVRRAAGSVPFGTLEFSREPGLAELFASFDPAA